MVAPMADKRINFGVGVMLGFIFVVGGHNGVSHLSSIERYDPHQNQWTACRPMNEPRTGESEDPDHDKHHEYKGKNYIKGLFHVHVEHEKALQIIDVCVCVFLQAWARPWLITTSTWLAVTRDPRT